MNPIIRLAKGSDVEHILNIYKPYILQSSISFERQIPSLEEFQQRFDEYTAIYPWLVSEVEGRIVGYAYASPHRERRSYFWSTEVTVYVDQKYQRNKVGSSLYCSLFQLLKHQGFRNAIAGVTLPNPSSEAIHQSLGFSKIGIYKNVGFKFGQWHDVAWYQMQLNDKNLTKEPTPIGELLSEKVIVKTVDVKKIEVREMIEKLNIYLNSLYSQEENFLDPIEVLVEKNCIVVGAYLRGMLVGIGAIKLLKDFAEVKRMFVDPIFRGLGISKVILSAVENRAHTNGFSCIRLETGKLQMQAVGLYEKSGYEYINPFWNYTENRSSVFMQKELEKQ